MFRVQLQKHPTAHLFFCIQSVALSQGRPENCPQPLFLEVSGPGPPLFPGQQVCLIHQQHIYLMLWHFLYVQLLEAHNRHIFTKQNKSKMWAFQQPAFTSGLELVPPPTAMNATPLSHQSVLTRSGHLNSKGFLASTIWMTTSLQINMKTVLP